MNSISNNQASALMDNLNQYKKNNQLLLVDFDLLI